MKNEEKEQGRGGKPFGKRGRGRPGKGDDKQSKPGANLTQEFIPDDEHVSAVSFMELPPEENTEITITLSVLHSAVWLDAIYNRAMHNNSDIVRDVIKKVARQYFVQVSPTTLPDIMDKVDDAVTASMKVFALICYLWKVQNALEFSDEKGINLSPTLFSPYSLYTCCSRKVMVNGKMGTNNDLTFVGDFSISNSDWKKQILSNLAKIYVSKTFADWAYTTIGHFIKFDYADEDQIRLWDIFPAEVAVSLNGTTKPTNWTLGTFVNLLEEQVDIVTNAFNTYPFIEEVLNLLGIVSPNDKYDFTRDLAQMHLNVLEDRDHALENMCYMTSIERNTSVDMPTSPKYRIVSTQLPSSYLFVYPDGEDKAAKSLKYVNRITISVNSLTNVFRGAMRSESVTYFQKSNSSGAYSYCIMGAINTQLSALPSNTDDGAKARSIAQYLWLHNIIDLPDDAIYFLNNSFNNIVVFDQDTGLIQGTDNTKIAPTGGCYLISVDDIACVTSDACAYMLFNVPALPAVSQTLGKDIATRKDIK